LQRLIGKQAKAGRLGLDKDIVLFVVIHTQAFTALLLMLPQKIPYKIQIIPVKQQVTRDYIFGTAFAE
jgi:hypothetical protein